MLLFNEDKQNVLTEIYALYKLIEGCEVPRHASNVWRVMPLERLKLLKEGMKDAAKSIRDKK